MTQPAIRKGPRDVARELIDVLEQQQEIADKIAAQELTLTMEVPDEFHPSTEPPVLLVADDGQSAVTGGAWLAGRDLLRVSIRLTVFANGRTEARAILLCALDLVCNRIAKDPDKDANAGISRIENIPAVLDTRDRDTGAYLASVTLPVLARQKK